MASKAKTLGNLKGKIKYASILELISFTVGEFKLDPSSCIKAVKSGLKDTSRYIVRSSSINEDLANISNAGKYESVLDVKAEDLADSINIVIESYGNINVNEDEIFIQPMLKNVTMSGVIFTICHNTGAPYYIINYDLTGDTKAVTSGAKNTHTQFIAHTVDKHPSEKVNRLIKLVKELQGKLKLKHLDVEFGFNSENELFLFQVRPLITKVVKGDDITFKSSIKSIKQRFKSVNVKHPYLYGSKTILGIMPDWNPAEIIGIRPKPLALSLYKELITDSTWAYQRDNYGYKNLRSFPLLIDLMGLPYIDVRVSFNSFLPKSLSPLLSEKLINYYLDQLAEFPHYHDKVEFDIIYSCYTFDLPIKLSRLKNFNFRDNEVEELHDSLRVLTNSIIHRKNGLWAKDSSKINELEKRHSVIFDNPEFDSLTKVYWLLEDCKRYGTLPFAGLARAAFIAVQLLQSMVNVNVLTKNDYMAFLNSLDTVSSNITDDLHTLNWDDFIEKYGHLRPGTYDILSHRYDEDPERYFKRDNLERNINNKHRDFRLSLKQMQDIEKLLCEHKLDIDVVGLFSFMKSAIEGREHSKFVFTKNLSDVLLLVKKFGLEYDITLDDLAYLDIKDLIKIYSSSWSIENEVLSSIERGKNKYEITQQISLPPLITNEENVEYFELPQSHPNFITSNVITANTITDLQCSLDMENSIVFIPSADPGYDWLFTRKIAGFITAYGGINSHMSIRAAELNIPAIIGAGKTLFEKWSKASTILLDCENKLVEIIA
jgi:glutamine kinase